MKTSDAAALIRTPLIEWARPQSWCDLGCGDGTFTVALAQSLPAGSAIHAIDMNPRALESIPELYNGVQIRKVLADLQSPGLRLPSVDGILMANSLHFIREQQQLLRKLLSVTNRFLIVEYERSRSSRWGPYPVDFKRLGELFSKAGVERVERIATRPSRFGGAMYSAFAESSVLHS
jgi:ubiquinone/menaquinone biosynthesis C-methylase UbiE